ncbi:MAG: hypothetical protein RSB95_04145 [Bacilli bacterium]
MIIEVKHRPILHPTKYMITNASTHELLYFANGFYFNCHRKLAFKDKSGQLIATGYKYNGNKYGVFNANENELFYFEKIRNYEQKFLIESDVCSLIINIDDKLKWSIYKDVELIATVEKGFFFFKTIYRINVKDDNDIALAALIMTIVDHLYRKYDYNNYSI